MFKNALVSCSNKKNLIEFLKPLQAQGLRILSTGGTAAHLRKAGLKVVDVSEQTGFEEVMDGRVKTLHPNIHMALLARTDEASDMATLSKYEIEPIDLVVGNLYPFEEAPSIETIDVGGPSFLRAAAKSFARIAVICDPADYEWVQNAGQLTVAQRQSLAAKVFSHTAAYDAMIAKYFAEGLDLNFKDNALGGEFVGALRYGENPAQKSTWYRTRGGDIGLHQAQILQGKELSYNNLLDLDAAISTVREFSHRAACVAVKHNNPCGVAVGQNAFNVLKAGLEADPQSVFGGIVACNFVIDAPMAEEMSRIFLECIIAPDIEPSALQIFAKKKNMRVLKWPEMLSSSSSPSTPYQYRSIIGGFLVQTQDQIAREWSDAWKIIGNDLDNIIKENLLLAWKVCAHLKSNAIAIVSAGKTVGLGMGQVNRVDAVQQAIERMQKHHHQARGAVLASDAFFPFSDSIEKIAQAGIRYVIQPGGSVKDNEVIEKAKELGVTLVMTGQRHFLH